MLFRSWEQAFVSVVSEAYVAGVSTRKVEQLVAPRANNVETEAF